MKEISLPGSDRPNSSPDVPDVPRARWQSTFECVLTNSHADVPSCKISFLSYHIPIRERRGRLYRACSLKLLVLQDSSPPLLRSVFSKGCGEPFREYFMGMAVWKNRFNRTYQRGGLGEAELPRKEESKLFPDFSWISNG